MTGDCFERLLAWVQHNPDRYMAIKVDRFDHGDEVTAFVYDYELRSGQRVRSVDEIDLLQAKIDWNKVGD